jgi:hypothetical protein
VLSSADNKATDAFLMTSTTATQRGIFASVATIRTLTKLLVGSVALLFVITASAQPSGQSLGPWTWTNVTLNDATTGAPSGTVTGSFTFVSLGPAGGTITATTTTTGVDATTFDSGYLSTGVVFLNSAFDADYTDAPGFVLVGLESTVPGGFPFETTAVNLAATPSDGSADIAFSVSDGTSRITGAGKVTCSNADCTDFTDGDEVDYDSVPPPTLVGPVPVITNYQYSLDGGAAVALSPEDNASPITISGLTNGTTYSITLQPLDSTGNPVGPPSDPVEVTLAGIQPGAGATAVPVGPLWLLGVMAGLLSLVAVRKLRKA